MNGDLCRQTMDFGLALKAQQPFAGLAEAQLALEADAETSALLRRFKTVQASLREKQMRNALTEENIRDFRAIRTQVGNSPLIRALTEAQREAIRFLQEVNARLSELLGLDFASLARPASGCC